MKQIINKLTKKPLNIIDFTAIVPWKYIEDKLYAKDYKRFQKWIGGQTATPDGVFIWDLERFISGQDSFRY